MPCPRAKTLLGDKGYDADWVSCRLGRPQDHRLHPLEGKPEGADPADAALYRQRYRIEIMFGRLKDWRRIHTRYDRCAHTFMSRHLHRCHRHLLAQSMSPEPRLSETRCRGDFAVTPFSQE
jgi:transposase